MPQTNDELYGRLDKLSIKEGETVFFHCDLKNPDHKAAAVTMAKKVAQHGCWFICLPYDVELKSLSDRDLKKLGLERVSDVKVSSIESASRNGAGTVG